MAGNDNKVDPPLVKIMSLSLSVQSEEDALQREHFTGDRDQWKRATKLG